MSILYIRRYKDNMRIEKRKRKNQELSGERREKKKKKTYTLNKINKSTLPFLLLFTLHAYVYLLLFHRCIFNHIGIKWIQLTINKCTTYYSNPSGYKTAIKMFQSLYF